MLENGSGLEKNVKIKREYAIIKENHKLVRLHILTESAELFEFNIIQIIQLINNSDKRDGNTLLLSSQSYKK